MSIGQNAALVGAAILVALTGAEAQTVYRCGNAYSSVPCADGKAVDTDDARSARQRAEAARVARDERRLGNDMARDRRAAESARRPQPAATLGPAKAVEAASPASASLKPKKKAKGKIRVVDPDDFIATVPKPIPTKPKPAP